MASALAARMVVMPVTVEPISVMAGDFAKK